MEIIDLSREIHHRGQVHPSHPPIVIATWYDHSEKKQAGNTVFSSKALSIAFSDHAGTHVDAPAHFNSSPEAKSIDEMPLEQFYTSGLCLDLSQVPLRHAITVPEMAAALAKSGEKIRQGDTVLVYMATNDRLLGKPGYLHDFPALQWNPCTGSPIRASECSGSKLSAPHPMGSLTSRPISPVQSAASLTSSASRISTSSAAAAASASLASLCEFAAAPRARSGRSPSSSKHRRYRRKASPRRATQSPRRYGCARRAAW